MREKERERESASERERERVCLGKEAACTERGGADACRARMALTQVRDTKKKSQCPSMHQARRSRRMQGKNGAGTSS